MLCVVVCQYKVSFIDYSTVIIIVGWKKGYKHEAGIMEQRSAIPCVRLMASIK